MENQEQFSDGFTKTLKDEFQLTDEQIFHMKNMTSWKEGYEYAKKVKEFRESDKKNLEITVKNVTEEGMIKIVETLASLSCSSINGYTNIPKCSEVNIKIVD